MKYQKTFQKLILFSKKKLFFVNVNDYYKTIKSIIETISFNRLRKFNEFLFTISIFIDRFFKTFVIIKKTIFRKRLFVK